MAPADRADPESPVIPSLVPPASLPAVEPLVAPEAVDPEGVDDGPVELDNSVDDTVLLVN